LTAFACAMAVGLSAQTPPPPGGAAQTPPSSGSSDKITVTGCLEKASSSPSPTGTSGAAGAASSAKFVLNDVTSGKSAPPGPAGTSGAAKSSASSYKLDGADSKLSPHVGHKVEISGTVDDDDDKPAGGKPGAPASASAGGPTLKVDAVKMIASSCTP
ncbi:MAG: hypothetical protein ACRD15_19160, partial [Vicinamibacterales bacterium]